MIAGLLIALFAISVFTHACGWVLMVHYYLLGEERMKKFFKKIHYPFGFNGFMITFVLSWILATIAYSILDHMGV